MEPRLRMQEHYTDLSHLSLLFRHGSQFIALRARFVDGRPSPFSGLGDLLRTVPAVTDLLCFWREGAEEEAEGSSAMEVKLVEERERQGRIEKPCHNRILKYKNEG